VVAAGSSLARGGGDLALVRYNAEGSLDPSFGAGGKVLTDLGSSGDDAFAVAGQPNGKIVAAGSGGGDFALVRYNADGSLDPSFSAGGKVLTDIGCQSEDAAVAVALQPNGKIAAAGSSGARAPVDFAVSRDDADGSIDL